ncbi:hypothetical protein WR25_15087 [Diploscapter pachys]|uniref:Ferlin B-domain domain-containing protein n=1 Tax=Diploscapter pachys TaxID=2018661 RepID=A0A2A2KCJ5_9BILA|nr:hypothetical protein WR25_15087 [Diploscapter pachys]
MGKVTDKLAKAFLKKKLRKRIGDISETDGEETEGGKSKDGKNNDDHETSIRTKDSTSNTSNATSTGGSTTSGASKILKKMLGKRRTESENSLFEGTEDDEDEEEGLVKAKRYKRFGMTNYIDVNRPATWHVLVRVIEGRDLDTGALRVRAMLDGSQKATRISTSGVPKWKQNLQFTLKNVSLQKLAVMMLTLKVTRAKRISEVVLGQFDVLLSAILHSPQRAVISKWVALGIGANDEEDEDESENAGFLKISLCIYGQNESPPPMKDDEGAEEVWCGAQLEEHTLRVRIYRLQKIAFEILQEVEAKKHKKPTLFLITVTCGDSEVSTGKEEIQTREANYGDTHGINFSTELYLPILWPCISFRLFMQRGLRKRCISEATIPLRSIYEPGEEGFMPIFGPSYINFFGYEGSIQLKRKKEKIMIDEGESSNYMGRCLVAVDCIEYLGDSSQRASLDYASIAAAKKFEPQHRYTAYVSFHTCNMINPILSGENVAFLVSMGFYGSPNASTKQNRSSTLAAMPDTDGCKYFAMPWGNMKPIADITCAFEDNDGRVGRSNAIMKMIAEARRQDGVHDAVASIALEAIDNADLMLERLENHHDKSTFLNELDQKREDARKKAIRRIVDEMVGFRYELERVYDKMSEEIVRFLTRLRDSMLGLARDCQIDVPPLMIKMVSNDKVLGYCKVPVEEICYSSNEALCGDWCGKLRTIPVSWPSKVNRKNRKEEVF